jgi:predicted lipoprotein with Yx(FWY)xxD motif
MIHPSIRTRRITLLLATAISLSLAACGPSEEEAAPADESMPTAAEMASPEVMPTEELPPTEEPTPAEAMAVTIGVATSETLGDHLVDGNGMSLYLFTDDTAEMSACTGDCAENWPPVVGEASAGDGVDASLLGTVARDDGTMQVTYNGHPLYWYAADAAPGDTMGQGAGEKWYLVTPAGEMVPAAEG